MWQQPAIALIALIAAGYVLWTVLPLPRRQAFLDACARRGVLRRRAERHRARLAAPGCGRCAGTGSQPPLRR
jgi:hypothetical protein